MGLDISFFVEVRRNGRWESADKWTATEEWEIEEGAPSLSVAFEDSFYNARDYEMFSILANERQSPGLVGKRDGGTLQCVSRPKGFPLDASSNLKAWIDVFQTDIRGWNVTSPSWLSLDELVNFDWEKHVSLHYQMQGEDYLKMLNNESYGKIRGHWGGAMSEVRARQKLSSKFKTTPEEAAARIRSGRVIAPKWVLKRSMNIIETVTYGDIAYWFKKDVMERMSQLGEQENVRCVFYFT
ncbi:MAG: hypothetical protein AAF498_07075 [Pseudomonadota bacterium]